MNPIKPQNNTFEKLRNIVMYMLYAALALCIIALIIMWMNSSSATAESVANTLVIIAVVLIGVGVLMALLLLKCPYCGKHIIRNVFRVDSCPHCQRNLVTGLKSKQGNKHHRLF